jgi:hypothetical protein
VPGRRRHCQPEDHPALSQTQACMAVASGLQAYTQAWIT